MRKVLISVVDDDRFFRESMSRLMSSMGYTVEIFSSAAAFLASPRLAEAACLIADVHARHDRARTLPTPYRHGPRDSDDSRDGVSQ